MESENKIYTITPKGALLIALCETFGSERIETEHVEKCFSRFCEMMGVDPNEFNGI